MLPRRFAAVSVALAVAAVGAVGAPTGAHAQGGSAAAPPAAAPAGPDKKLVEAARTAYKKGEKAYDAKKWKEAYKHFKKAFDTLPSPHALYWMAMSLDQQGLKKEAYEAFVTFFSEARFDKVGEEKVGIARGRLNALGAEPGELVIRPDPADAVVEIDGAAQAGTGPRKVTLPGGRHTVKVSAPGKQAQTLEISVAPFGATDQAITLSAEEAAPPPPPASAAEPPPPPPVVEPAPAAPPAATTAPSPPAEEKSNLPAYITLGVAGVGAIVGTVFGLQALSAQSDFDANPSTELADDAERNALIADVGFFTAITLGVTGVVLLTASDESEGAPPPAAARVQRPTLRVAPYVTPQGAGAAARWRF